jgi:CBS domain-containing protein
MEEAFGARDFMVRDPVCASPWQPISSVRRNMLANSFSFLPLAVDQSGASIWKLVSDFSIAFYLRAASSRSERTRRLARQLGDVVGANEIALLNAPVCGPEESVATILERSKGLPVLVIGLDGNLRGIITPFDVL